MLLGTDMDTKAFAWLGAVVLAPMICGAGPDGGALDGGGTELCPAEPGITECGREACDPVDADLAMLCVQNCCTADTKCGRRNGRIAGATCQPKSADPDPDCTPIMVSVVGMLGGCCMDDGVTCGLQDTTGLFGGGCVSRCMTASLVPDVMALSCDGATMMACSEPEGGGAGGQGGEGGAGGSGGAGGAGGAGGTDDAGLTGSAADAGVTSPGEPLQGAGAAAPPARTDRLVDAGADPEHAADSHADGGCSVRSRSVRSPGVVLLAVSLLAVVRRRRK